jgi:dihydrofolate reductase
MSKVTADISMSLDGFITDLEASVGTRLEGNDPGRLHDWRFDAKTDADEEIVAAQYGSTGAVLIGKRMFDAGEDPWGDPPPFGMPVVVLTHEARASQPMQGGTTYHFVSGLEAALDRARAEAGDKDVGVWGGANTIAEYLQAGLLDEIEIHLVPIVLGRGVRLFENLMPDAFALQRTRTIDTPAATHLRFDVVKTTETTARYVLLEGPDHVIDESAPIKLRYHAWFTGPDGAAHERYLTDGGRAALLDAIDHGKREFSAGELHAISVPPDMDALVARYDQEAGVGG